MTPPEAVLQGAGLDAAVASFRASAELILSTGNGSHAFRAILIVMIRNVSQEATGFEKRYTPIATDLKSKQQPEGSEPSQKNTTFTPTPSSQNPPAPTPPKLREESRGQKRQIFETADLSDSDSNVNKDLVHHDDPHLKPMPNEEEQEEEEEEEEESLFVSDASTQEELMSASPAVTTSRAPVSRKSDRDSHEKSGGERSKKRMKIQKTVQHTSDLSDDGPELNQDPSYPGLYVRTKADLIEEEALYKMGKMRSSSQQYPESTSPPVANLSTTVGRRTTDKKSSITTLHPTSTTAHVTHAPLSIRDVLGESVEKRSKTRTKKDKPRMRRH